MLADLGYKTHEIATKATPVALSLPFRLLSSEGASVMLEVARVYGSSIGPPATVSNE